MQHFPEARLIRFDASLVIVARAVGAVALTLGAVAAVLVHFAPIWREELNYGVISVFLLYLALAVVHLVLALIERCPTCGKHPLVQGFAPVHPASVGQGKGNGWDGAVWSIVHRRRFTCIHCGTAYSCAPDA
jgi:hypothetical protein